MVDFLLLHGMCVGAWEWERLIPVLRADPRVGTVIAPEMPGRGVNRSRDFETISIGDYVESALAALRADDLRDTIVVGHSGGGAYLQAVVAAEPERVRQIVFLSAAVPERGRSLLDRQPPPLRLASRFFLWLTRARRRGIRASGRLATRGMCHDLRPEDCAPFISRLVPEPPALLTERIDWDPARVRVPATYILTEQDRVIRPKDQARMARDIDDVQFVRLPMGHARPVMEPDRLARVLLSFA